MEHLQKELFDLVLVYGPRLLGAIIVLLIGLQLISWFSKWFRRFLETKSLDASLRPFLRSMLVMLLKVLLVISVMGMVGIQMTSFIAILGAAGLAVGLALSGTLQNFAGGVILLIFKPFKVGDFITASGYSGTVSEIQIFVTILRTPDNKTIILPNGSLATTSLTNFSTLSTRRVDWSYGIAYGDSFDKAKEVLLRLISEDQRILDDPAPFIALGELSDSSVNITVRVWVNASDFWGVFFDMNEKVYNTFPKEGLNIPFPQMDVHLKKGE
ncbi:mechanosensitive ion channel family protein [Alkalitalea saponilacus]|uniref:Small conductance mechanosensitive channel n=1 Tax=Alkalitalea saponilacus TaxID=889453 RepID=A0A1T5FX49_9BACT|nr:mechanosensitive ion channel domain-containing protein [Alkalitalea saponilacus]ASB49517.1 mechanosensitive ion channel protein MscS [Alkalitalea saponilacus]SKC00667.1 small conductance mechanosensitive channel [Alkalitalea saponilacus]